MNRFQLFASAITISSIISLGSATGAKAQAPSMHFGFDTRPITVAECIRRAQEIISVKGFEVSTVGKAVAGKGPDVVVLVFCAEMPGGAHILVTAASPTSIVAERTRNEVRIAVMR